MLISVNNCFGIDPALSGLVFKLEVSFIRFLVLSFAFCYLSPDRERVILTNEFDFSVGGNFEQPDIIRAASIRATSASQYVQSSST